MNKFKPIYYVLLLIVITSWFMLAVKLNISLERNMSNGLSFSGALVMFFSYFTVLTNIFCNFSLSLFLFNKTKPQTESRTIHLFLQEKTISALSTSILLVGIIYYLLLFDLWNPQGWDYITDLFLHLIMPVIFPVYWFFTLNIRKIKLKNMLMGVAYPLTYFVFILSRGLISDVYPYPFIDINVLGLRNVLMNVMLLVVLFELIALSLFFGKKQFVRHGYIS